MATLFKVPSIKKVIDCSETFIIKDSCDKTAATPTLSTNILSSASSLSSSNSVKDGSVEVIKGVKSCNCKEKNVEKDVSCIEVDDSPQKTDNTAIQETFPEGGVDNVANFINIRKLVGKNETNYYYSKANLSSRKRIENIKRKKKKRRGTLDNLDESVNSRKNFLTHSIRASAYQGPRPLKKDGSSIQSIMKRRSGRASLDSTLSTNASHSTVGSRCKGSVTFSHIDVRVYERVPGDNPCVRAGVPLSIGWAHVQHDPIPLDEYETGKGPPRDKIEMMVPASVRRTMLRDEFAASITDLNAAMKSVNISKRQRAHTLASEHIEVLEEVLESAKRKFKRVVGKAVSTKKQEAALWEASHDAVMNEYLEKALKGEELVEMELHMPQFVSDESATDSLHSLEANFPPKCSP
eukprot:scaffold33582_cov119-Skeletonema_dohrnii-CCMP3373.AAC.2